MTAKGPESEVAPWPVSVRYEAGTGLTFAQLIRGTSATSGP
jgi:hypothetical protein